MKKYLLLFILFLTVSIYSQESIGLDSGHKEILMFSKETNSNNAILIIGGIHGDEKETVDVVNYLMNNISTNISTFYIPEVNPTLSSKDVQRRGYLKDNLDNNGFVKNESLLFEFNKSLYYRIFYGNEGSYKNGISHYIDPNRDFTNKILPSTRVLINLINKLSNNYNEVIIISIHGYMSGGRVYPEYLVNNNKEFSVKDKVWDMAKIIGSGAQYIPEKMYAPAITILDRFNGELLVFTGKIDNVTAFDIEIDGKSESNSLRTLNGINKLLLFLDK